MKSPRQPFRPALEAATWAAREALADQVYDSVTVKAALSAEAGKGFSFAVITTPIAVDLRETANAKAVIAWLGKEGLRAEWNRRGDPHRAHAYGSDFWDLMVSWEGGAASLPTAFDDERVRLAVPHPVRCGPGLRQR